MGEQHVCATYETENVCNYFLHHQSGELKSVMTWNGNGTVTEKHCMEAMALTTKPDLKKKII
jgi:hypothetical protein